MPALPPKLGANPSPQDINRYREELEEYAKSLEEKQEEQTEKEKTLKHREDKAESEQARLEGWYRDLQKDREEHTTEREKYKKDKEKLDKDLKQLRITSQGQIDQQQKLDDGEQLLKIDEAKLEVLKKEVGTLGEPGKGVGIDTTILLQQKELLKKCFDQNKTTSDLVERQLKLEEKRENREKEKKEEKEKLKLATGKAFKPPSFKGVQGERTEAHILRAQDWMDASNPEIQEEQKIKNFRLTLDHHEREWYDKADCKRSWKDLKLGFSRYFSTQGRSVFNLHERWKKFKFNPQKDDIEEFVRNVQETATQLKYGDEAVANMIKTCMPMNMYTSLYEITDLEKIISKVRDIYARPVVDPDSTDGIPSAVASGTPFSAMQGMSTEQYMYMQGQGGDNKQKPFKPYVTPRGRGRSRGRGRGARGRGRGRGCSQENKFQGRGQFSFRGTWQPRGSRVRGQRFDLTRAQM